MDLAAHPREHDVARPEGEGPVDAVHVRVDELDVVGLPQVVHSFPPRRGKGRELLALAGLWTKMAKSVILPEQS